MGARNIPDALTGLVLRWLAVLSALPVAAMPQNAERAGQEHTRAVYCERVSALIETFDAADAVTRDGIERALLLGRTPGSGAWSPFSFESICDSPRAVSDPERSDRQVELDRVADSIDLLPAPGAAPAMTEGLGEQVVVHVRPTRPLRVSADIQLALYWLAPDGSEQLARREPVEAAGLQPPGFEMFLRAPVAEAGTWRLVPEVESRGLSARGVPVVFEVIERLHERSQAVLSQPAPQGTPGHELARAFALRVQRGLRVMSGLQATEILGLVERAGADGSVERDGSPVPERIAFRDARGADRWLWGVRVGTAVERAVVLLVPSYSSPDAVLSRAPWKEFCERERAWVLACHAPSSPRDSAGLREVLEGVRKHTGAVDLTCVALGDTLGQLEMGTGPGSSPPWSSLIFSVGRPMPNAAGYLATAPRLLVGPGGSADWPDELAAWTPETFLHVRGPQAAIFNEARLDELVSRWWELQASVR